MTLNYSIIEGVLEANGLQVKLPFPSVQALDVDGLIIVRIEPAIGAVYNRNVFALSENGNIEWQIEESPHGTERDKPYTSISVIGPSQLVAGNWNGVDYLVSLRDGSISAKAFNK